MNAVDIEPHAVLLNEVETMLGRYFHTHMIRRLAQLITTVLMEHHRGDYIAAKAEATVLCTMGDYRVYLCDHRMRELPNLQYGRFRFDVETREWVVLNP